MAARKKAEEAKLARIAEIARAGGPAADLRPLLRDHAAYIVAGAAHAAQELRATELARDLEEAFVRLVDSDSACIGITAIVRALSHMEIDTPDVYLRGLRVRRGPPDHATGLRIESARALAITRYSQALLAIVPLLFDAQSEVRAGAADAIGALRSDAAAAVLYTRLLAPESSLDARHACMVGVLRCAPERFVPVVADMLDHEDEGFAEVAALALGESREAAALAPLRRTLEGRQPSRFTSSVLSAIAMLRSDESAACVLDLAENAQEKLARQALEALAAHAPSPTLAERARAIEARRFGAK